ncbi:MAG TPA: hypothetical protein VHY35_15995 [Stellaceae bacterium]|jgi:hypothetical protein|nr:hypothetical protein [Stellaceae bacterium]
MASLQDIVARTGAFKPIYYLPMYERLFAPIRFQPFSMLELGIWNGGSVKAWEDYLPQARIAALDLNVPELDVGPRVHLYAGDQTDTALLSRIAAEVAPEGFDVIIDDASHVGAMAKTSFWHLFDMHLKAGAYYCIEDWGTGYMPSWPDGREFVPEPDTPSRMPSHDVGLVGFVKQLVDEIHADLITPEGRVSKFASVSLYAGLCIIQKLPV